MLTISSQNGCEISARLERGGYGDTPACSSRSWAPLRRAAFELRPNGRLDATGALNGREYAFAFTVVDGRLSGTFQAETPSSTYRGTVTDDRL